MLLLRQQFTLWFLGSLLPGIGFGIHSLLVSHNPNRQVLAAIFILFWGLSLLFSTIGMVVENLFDSL